jgi:hypothetical protein
MAADQGGLNERPRATERYHKSRTVTVVAAIVLAGLAFVGAGLPFSLTSGRGGPTSSWGV